MAETTINTFLMYKEDSATEYTKLCDIKDYPDLFGEPDALESTTLSSQAKEYLEGLAGTDKFSFTANYDKTVFDTLIGLKGKEQSLAVQGMRSTGDEPREGWGNMCDVWICKPEAMKA